MQEKKETHWTLTIFLIHKVLCTSPVFIDEGFGYQNIKLLIEVSDMMNLCAVTNFALRTQDRNPQLESDHNGKWISDYLTVESGSNKSQILSYHV